MSTWEEPIIGPNPCSECGGDYGEHVAGCSFAASTGYAVHVDGITGEIDPATQAALDKMAGLLRKKELIRTGNTGVDANGVIVDMRENPKAVRLPPHNEKDQV